MSSGLQLDVRHHIQWRRLLVNAYEVKAGMVFFGGYKLCDQSLRRYKVVCKALYKCSAFLNHVSCINCGKRIETLLWMIHIRPIMLIVLYWSFYSICTLRLMLLVFHQNSWQRCCFSTANGFMLLRLTWSQKSLLYRSMPRGLPVAYSA